MENNVKNAKVKKDGRFITVYKLKSGKWNIFLGEDISQSKVTIRNTWKLLVNLN